MARPSDYTPEKAAEVCTALIEGKSLRSICAADDMPAIATVYLWLGKQHEFMEQYARAREDQADTLADEIIDIADKADNDNANARRLQVDARKWVASKLKPKKYGDKLDTNVNLSGKLVIGWTEPQGS